MDPLSDDARPRLLAVLAHPDDETFGIGGTLALYSSCGAETHYVCATQGEVGEMPAEYLLGYAEPAERRVAELRAAAARLGLTSVTFLGYRDSGMPGSPDNSHPRALAAAPEDEVVTRVVQQIRLHRPHVVITFDPIGGYRHPDHIAIQRATVRAFREAADPAFPSGLPPYAAQKLLFTTFSRGFLRAMVATLRLFGRDPRRFGTNGDIDLLSIAEVEFPIHTSIDIRAVDRVKASASACHVSQGGSPTRFVAAMSALFRLFGGHEVYMQAFPEPAPGLRNSDLFAGVRLGRE
jgi:LmbE family N-acetylglucosaminyl deacetylase